MVLSDRPSCWGTSGWPRSSRTTPRRLTIGAGTLGNNAAPEQLEPNARVDQPADVFGAAAVLAEVVTGEISPAGRLDDLSGIDPQMATVLARV